MVRRSRRVSGRRTRRHSRHSMKSRRVRRMRHTRGRGKRGGEANCATQNDRGNTKTGDNGNTYICSCSAGEGGMDCKWYLK
jgi:hypothetical protein